MNGARGSVPCASSRVAPAETSASWQRRSKTSGDSHSPPQLEHSTTVIAASARSRSAAPQRGQPPGSFPSFVSCRFSARPHWTQKEASDAARAPQWTQIASSRRSSSVV